MLRPKYIERLPDALIALYAQAESDILVDMARRISTYDYWIPAANWQYKKLIEMGNFHSYVMKALSSRTKKSEAELLRLMQAAGAEALRFDIGIYREHDLDPPPLAASKTLQAVLKSGLAKTAGTFQNLTKTTARTASQQFERALDRAYMQITSGAFDRGAAVRTAVKDLAKQGLTAIHYPSGHRDTIEVAVRRAVVTGVNQTALQLQLVLADEMGCDLVETSAHGGARPTHAAWQGQVFSRSGKAKGYPPFSDTGYGSGAGLGGWNCRHSFFPYFEGSPRTYTSDALKKLEEKSYTYNGNAMTEYEATQNQRYIERKIRRWKRENVAMSAAGMDATESAVKVRMWQQTQHDFLRQTGLNLQRDRAVVADFGRREAFAAVQAGNRFDRFAEAFVGIITSSGIRVGEVSPHVFAQAENREVSAQGMINALTTPLKAGKIRADSSQQFIGEHATVVINAETGKLVTAWKTSRSKVKKLKGGETS